MRILAAGLCLFSAHALAVDAGADHSFANIDQFQVTHIDLNLDVDFDSHQLRGSATLTVHRLDPAATHLVLDSRGLNVTDVDELTSDFLGATEQIAPIWVSRPFHGGDADPTLGRPLVIDLPPTKAADETLRIQYETSPQAAGLHWPVAASGHRPRARDRFFYTLPEPIGARSWIPLQDTPRALATVRAHIHTPDDLIALMSGADDQKQRRAADHWFVLARPIPAYSIGLVVGDLKFKSLGPHVGLYGQSGILTAAAADLDRAQATLDALQSLTGWRATSRADIVVMPPNFPIGDAEFPKLIFVSPTAIGGSDSADSWLARALFVAADADPPALAGWDDRWISRAFAGYLQSRVVRTVYGARRGEFGDALEAMALRDAMARIEPRGQALAADAAQLAMDREPSDIACQKGRLLFDFLDNRFGTARFDAFVRAYFMRFAGRSITTAEFLDYLQANLLDRYPGIATRAQINAWVFDPGIPAGAGLPSANGLEPLDQLRSAWSAGRISAKALDARHWSSAEWTYFLGGLPDGQGPSKLADLDSAYALTRSRDAQLEAHWLLLAIREGYEPAFARVEQYLQAVGRVRLIAPLYTALLKSPAGTALAKRVYSAARPGYDPTAAQALDALLQH